MKKQALTAVVSMLILALGAQSGMAQNVPINFDQGFSIKGVLKGLEAGAKTLPSVVGKDSTPAPATVPVSAARKLVRISGNIRLAGTEYINDRDGFIYITLTDQVRLDSGFEYRTDTIWVRESVSFFIRKGQSYVSEYVRVSEWVSVYKNGRYVGRVNVTGTIRVSGWVNGSWLRLDGTGTLNGSFYANEE